MNAPLPRRRFLGLGALGAAAIAHRDPLASLYRPGEFAQRLSETPATTEGPFYPDKMPLDTDNDLLIVNDAINPAVGKVTHLSGRVLDTSGEPLRNAFVEIWQVDNKGSYIHSGGTRKNGRDDNFQGYGRFLTDVRGNYYFRTIQPISYGEGRGRRVPHIHVAVSHNGKRLLTTEIGIDGYRGNDDDVVFGRLSKEQRALLMAEYRPLRGSKIGELTAEFDLVLAQTPAEDEEGRIRGGIGKRQRRD